MLPRDKRQVVLTLKDKFKYVVGMTGDGVNDAPALSAAQCGIAVDGATDAAKNAAAIILTSPGLSAIYAAVFESRRIFRKLKSYATYRFAATIQIVTVLTLLIYIADCSIDSLYIVLLALFNDITMLPIAYDLQVASKNPEHPDVRKMLIMSLLLGAAEAGLTLLFAFGIQHVPIFKGDYSSLQPRAKGFTVCDTSTQAIIWLQMFIAAEILIFSARAQSYIWLSIRPSIALFVSVLAGCFIFCMLAGQSGAFGSLPAIDILLIWAYDLVGLFVIDALKVQIMYVFGESTEILPDIDDTLREDAVVAQPVPEDGTEFDLETGLELKETRVRQAAADERDMRELSEMSSRGRPTAGSPSEAQDRASVTHSAKLRTRMRNPVDTAQVAVHGVARHGAAAMRGSGLVHSSPLHPNTPGSLAIIRHRQQKNK